jgi:hypothetical protein
MRMFFFYIIFFMLVFKFQLMNMAINLKMLMYLSETLSFGYWPKKWIKKDLIKKKHSHIFPDVPNKTCTLSLLKFIGIYLKKKQKKRRNISIKVWLKEQHPTIFLTFLIHFFGQYPNDKVSDKYISIFKFIAIFINWNLNTNIVFSTLIFLYNSQDGIRLNLISESLSKYFWSMFT